MNSVILDSHTGSVLQQPAPVGTQEVDERLEMRDDTVLDAPAPDELPADERDEPRDWQDDDCISLVLTQESDERLDMMDDSELEASAPDELASEE